MIKEMSEKEYKKKLERFRYRTVISTTNISRILNLREGNLERGRTE